ncbi:hypothetical protein F3Y22_tig00110597pilonHSYRG00282 [Hibiscus syriacus]|uniref:MADS-box domain-containing protein n=1 Tax=Hibiscus syriacus TaxID=106335 RepID=A0A6A3A5S9_HIBSY|nr:hypothetical protein F3Y22_tig00110597pilonHSYRG00282 [Hibiscus syriacus]
MGHKKKKIDNSWSRHMTYIKRRDSILKKASDLSMLSNTDVGLMMFSPTGQFTSFASKGRIEDIFLRFLDWCDECGQPLENHEVAYPSFVLSFAPFFKTVFVFLLCCILPVLTALAQKLEAFEELERKLSDLHRKKSEAEEKMRSYNPDMIPKLSISEATHRQQIVMDAIQRIEKLKHEKLLEKEISPSNLNKVEMPALVVGSSSAAAEVTNLETQRNVERDRNSLGISYQMIATTKTSKSWNLRQVEDMAASEGHMSWRHKFRGKVQHHCG